MPLHRGSACLLVAFAAHVAVVCVVAQAEARAEACTVEGSVVSSENAAMRGAQISLESKRGGAAQSTMSDADGAFAFPSAGCGTFVLRVKHAGYQEHIEELDSASPRSGLRIVLSRVGSSGPAAAPVPAWALGIPGKARKEYQRGIALLKAHKRAQAAARFQSAVKLYPRYATAWSALGATQFALGDARGAAGSFAAGLKIESSLMDALLGMGAAHNALGEPYQAEKYLLHALELKRDDWRIHAALAASYSALEKWPAAEAHLRRAAALQPDFAHTHLRLIDALLRQEKLASAVEAMDEFLRRFPGHESARRVQERRAAIRLTVAATPD